MLLSLQEKPMLFHLFKLLFCKLKLCCLKKFSLGVGLHRNLLSQKARMMPFGTRSLLACPASVKRFIIARNPQRLDQIAETSNCGFINTVSVCTG